MRNLIHKAEFAFLFTVTVAGLVSAFYTLFIG